MDIEITFLALHLFVFTLSTHVSYTKLLRINIDLNNVVINWIANFVLPNFRVFFYEYLQQNRALPFSVLFSLFSLIFFYLYEIFYFWACCLAPLVSLEFELNSLINLCLCRKWSVMFCMFLIRCLYFLACLIVRW